MSFWAAEGLPHFVAASFGGSIKREPRFCFEKAMLEAQPAGAVHQPRLVGSFSGGAKHGAATPDWPRPLEGDPHTLQGIRCHAMTCSAVLCPVPLCDAMFCVAMLCDAMLHYAMRRHAMTCYALQCSSTPCYDVLYHASRTLSGSLPCSTSDCANTEEIYAVVREGRER